MRICSGKFGKVEMFGICNWHSFAFFETKIDNYKQDAAIVTSVESGSTVAGGVVLMNLVCNTRSRMLRLVYSWAESGSYMNGALPSPAKNRRSRGRLRLTHCWPGTLKSFNRSCG
jgi:hypothetical protein